MLLVDHRHPPKIQRKPINTERKRRQPNPAKENSRSKNWGVRKLSPLKESRHRDYQAYLPPKRMCLCWKPRISLMSCSISYTDIFNCLNRRLMCCFLSSGCIYSFLFLLGVSSEPVVCHLGLVGSRQCRQITQLPKLGASCFGFCCDTPYPSTKT